MEMQSFLDFVLYSVIAESRNPGGTDRNVMRILGKTVKKKKKVTNLCNI